MNPYLRYVEEIAAAVKAAGNLTVSGTTPVRASDSKVLLFSPHPDDECIIGTLPLRLMREAGMEIINIPVTFGSRKDRQAARSEELRQACGYLGWRISRMEESLEALDVEEAVRLLARYQPAVVFFPHEKDWNSRHISTHHLAVAALKEMGEDFHCTVVETEFWGAMDDPNLMVEADHITLADLVAATSLHVGEVERNPYHLLLPAWMQDNVRRGGERVGGQGQAAPDYAFATLYRLRNWQQGGFADVLERGLNIPAGAEPLKESYPWKS